MKFERNDIIVFTIFGLFLALFLYFSYYFLTPPPEEGLTELYFLDVGHLPKVVAPHKEYPISFRVVSHDPSTVNYTYEIYCGTLRTESYLILNPGQSVKKEFFLNAELNVSTNINTTNEKKIYSYDLAIFPNYTNSPIIISKDTMGESPFTLTTSITIDDIQKNPLEVSELSTSIINGWSKIVNTTNRLWINNTKLFTSVEKETKQYSPITLNSNQTCTVRLISPKKTLSINFNFNVVQSE